MPIKHLRQIELADRWKISPRTLERWRWIGAGPPYLKIGGRVLYRIEDIERYEHQQRRPSGTGPGNDLANWRVS
jgi:predicted site-specific integrase-resolvase